MFQAVVLICLILSASAGVRLHSEGAQHQDVHLRTLSKRLSSQDQPWSAIASDSQDSAPRPKGGAKLARLILLMSSSCYSIDYSLTKIVQRTVPPETAVALKFIIAAVFSFPLLLLAPLDQRSVRIGLEIGCWSGAAAISMGRSLSRHSASKVSFVSAMAVIMPPIYDFLQAAWVQGSGAQPVKGGHARKGGALENVALTTAPFVAPLFAIAGAVVLDGTGAGMDSGALIYLTPIIDAMGTWRAEKLGAEAVYDIRQASAVMLATSALFATSYAVAKLGTPQALSPASVWSTISTIISLKQIPGIDLRSLWWSLWSSVQRLLTLAASNWHFLAVLAASSFLGTLVTTVAEQVALTMVSAAETFLLLAMEPILATVFAALFLGETFGIRTFIAASLVLCACSWGSFVEYLFKVRSVDRTL
ncbi:hypothetical protein B484DRAFT_455440 [Ochromonadaceae sp. CCMP2298]|nr:hypothetical protein B484DRAFT_455440 [Ochromonadaceae sp. CCMP2298]